MIPFSFGIEQRFRESGSKTISVRAPTKNYPSSNDVRRLKSKGAQHIQICSGNGWVAVVSATGSEFYVLELDAYFSADISVSPAQSVNPESLIYGWQGP